MLEQAFKLWLGPDSISSQEIRIEEEIIIIIKPLFSIFFQKKCKGSDDSEEILQGQYNFFFRARWVAKRRFRAIGRVIWTIIEEVTKSSFKMSSISNSPTFFLNFPDIFNQKKSILVGEIEYLRISWFLNVKCP